MSTPFVSSGGIPTFSVGPQQMASTDVVDGQPIPEIQMAMLREAYITNWYLFLIAQALAPGSADEPQTLRQNITDLLPV